MVISRRINLRKLFLLGLLCAALMAAVSRPASAASLSRNLTISPAGVNETLKPGSTKSSSILVRNSGNTGYNYSVYAAPYSVSSEAYTPNFMPVPGAPKVASWLSFKTTSGYLGPGSSVVISYTLSVPAGTPAGGYYLAAFVQTKPIASTQTKGIIQINQRIGELFYLQVAGPVTEKGSIASWQAKLLQKPPASANLRLENDGGLHYFSNVTINFSNIFGGVKYTYYGRYAVLPHTIRRVNVSWPHPPFIGLYKVNGSATTYGNHVLPTRYILIASPLARVIIIAVFALIILVFTCSRIIRTARKGIKQKVKTRRHD